MQRPFPSPGLGWILAVIGLILCVLNLIGGTHVAEIYLLILAFLAILL